MKMYEYLACNKAAIVSDVKGLEDSFKDVAIVAKAENSKSLANKIIKLIKSSKLRERLGRRG